MYTNSHLSDWSFLLSKYSLSSFEAEGISKNMKTDGAENYFGLIFNIFQTVGLLPCLSYNDDVNPRVKASASESCDKKFSIRVRKWMLPFRQEPSESLSSFWINKKYTWLSARVSGRERVKEKLNTFSILISSTKLRVFFHLSSARREGGTRN